MACVDNNHRRTGLPMGQIILLLGDQTWDFAWGMFINPTCSLCFLLFSYYARPVFNLCMYLTLTCPFHISFASQLLELTTRFSQKKVWILKLQQNTSILRTDNCNISPRQHRRVNINDAQVKKSHKLASLIVFSIVTGRLIHFLQPVYLLISPG